MDPTSNISRWVAFLIAPLSALAGGFVALKANTWFGMHLDPVEVTAYVTTLLLGIFGLAIKWLHNRGRFEIAQATGIGVDELDAIAALIEERLPAPPTKPAPGRGAAKSPRAPGKVKKP